MKLPFRGRPLGDDYDYDYDDEDEEFDPSPPPSGRSAEGPIRIGGAATGAVPPVTVGSLTVPPPVPPSGRPSGRGAITGETPAVGQRRGSASVPPPVTASARLRSGPGPSGSVPSGRRLRAPIERMPDGPLTPGPPPRPAVRFATPTVRARPTPHDQPEPPGPAAGSPPEAGHQLAPAPGVVSAEDFAQEMHRLRQDSSSEQRSAWAYLGLLGALFVLVVGFGYGCSGRIGGGSNPLAPSEMLTSAQPARLVFKIQGELVTLTGSVPDDDTRALVVKLAKATYTQENVVDALSVDTGTTFTGGSIRVVGSSLNGDKRPAKLKDQVIKSFGVADRGFEVGFSDKVLAPVAASVSVNGAKVALSGILPDVQSVAGLTTLAGELWGAPNVDATNLSAGDTTWSQGRVQLVGTAVATDPRIVQFSTLASQRLGAPLAVDTSGLAPGDNATAVAAAQTAVSTLVAASPIKFGADSADIDPTSDAILLQVAAALAQVPNTAIEIVGHTDSQGDDQHNLTLSQNRARAVLDRLVSLGVPALRLSSRGEGEANPVADNNSDAGRAANRRIDFHLVGR